MEEVTINTNSMYNNHQQELLDMGEDINKEVITDFRNHGFYDPTAHFIYCDVDGELRVKTISLFKMVEDKDKCSRYLKKEAKKFQAMALVFAFEAYRLEGSKEIKKNNPHQPLSENPSSIESVFVEYESIYEKKVWVYDVKRLDGILGLEGGEVITDGNWGGRFGNTLPRWKPVTIA